MLDIYPELSRDEKPRLIVPALIWFFVIVALIVIALMLTGCASEPQKPETLATFQGVCMFKPIGKDEHGNLVALTYCEAR